MNIDDVKNNTIIICSNNDKKNILKKLNNINKLLPIKFINKKEFITSLTFFYDNKTIYYVTKKYNIKKSIASTYLDNLYYIENKKYDNEKLDFLVNLKNDLENNNLLIKNNLFLKFIENKDVIFYNLGYIDKYLMNLINSIKPICNVKIVEKENNNFEHNVYEFVNINDEIFFIASQICKLISDGININNIKLVCQDYDYYHYIKRIFKMYNIPVNINNEDSIYFTNVCKYLIDNFTSDLTHVINEMKSKFDLDLVSKIIKVINNYTFEEDKIKVKDLIIEDLRNTYINNEKYINAVEFINLNESNEDDYVFLMGFNEKFVPKIYKDEDYLTDNEKKILNISTSIEKNKYEKKYTISLIKSIKNLTITFKLENTQNTFYPSGLINEMNLNVLHINNDYNYSNLANKIKLCSYLDRFYKYNEENKDLALLYNNYHLNYRTYDNTFKNIDSNLLNKLFNDNLKLSYSSMENYNECAFKFLITNILKLDVFEDNFAAFLGSLFHHILEIGLDKEINLDDEVNKYLIESNKEFSNKDLFYIEKIKKDILLSLEVIKEQSKYSTLKNIKNENEFDVTFEGKFKTIFKGFIDKIIYKIIDDNIYVAIIDYKTYDIDAKMDLLKHGLKIQLPIYLYLVKKNMPNAIIVGFYIQKVLALENTYNETESLMERKKKNLKLSGYSNSDGHIIGLLDYNYKDSNVIKGLKVKNDGSYYQYSKVLSNEQMDEIYNDVENVIKNVINNIENGKFDINPKVYEEKNISCTYCKFKDLCYKTSKDEVTIEKEDKNE